MTSWFSEHRITPCPDQAADLFPAFPITAMTAITRDLGRLFWLGR
jgi:hypothetical protein